MMDQLNLMPSFPLITFSGGIMLRAKTAARARHDASVEDIKIYYCVF